VTQPGDAILARLVRDETGRLVASLARATGDLDVAEEAVQEAIVEALQAWRRDGPPPNPGGWLHTAARRNALDRLRRRARHREKLMLLPERSPPDAEGEPDDRLRLLFTCCHPALSPQARVALTLRAVLGLTTAEIARAFLTSEQTTAQRIVRAKRKIVDAGIGFGVPDDLVDRLDPALAVVYLAYNEGYLTTAGDVSFRRDLAEDSIWLATLVAAELPRQPEALGLLALLLLLHARQRARFDPAGGLVLLAEQDRSRWDAAGIADGVALLERAAKAARPGRYQLQAAIAAVHAEAPSWEATDWPQILVLYELLRQVDDSPVVRLNRAVALAHVAGPEAALGEVDALGATLRGYHLLHATRAQLLRMLGRADDARDADVRALALTGNPAEKALIRRRLSTSG
jgi:RNA polymerase sigma-70 factor (ECF subfamily)